MKKIQQGFSLITAIFLLVVLSFLGVAMVSFSTVQHHGEAMDVMGVRAYQAARAGIEWAAFYVTQSPANSPTAWMGCAAGTPVALSGDLSVFTVTVDCTATSYTEGAATVWIYDVSAFARTGGNPGSADYIERVISVKLGK